MAPTILIAEDEENISDILTAYLQHDGFNVRAVTDGSQALSIAKTTKIDLLLLDVMLPGMMGFEVLENLRQHSRLPVILLTSLSNETNRLHGFDLGADDYICKPFSPREVIARIKSVLRRVQIESAPIQVIEPPLGQLALNDDNFTAAIGCEKIIFTPSEFKLLKLFANRPNRIFSREELLDEVTGHFSECSYRAIDSHIKNLRRKLSSAAPQFHIIQSVYGVGYKLNQPFVSRVGE